MNEKREKGGHVFMPKTESEGMVEIVPEVKEEVLSVDEDFIAMAKKRVETIKKLKQIAIRITTYKDWVNQNGNPYLLHSGAERIARLYGISLRNVKIEKVFSKDSLGEYYIYKATGVASLPNGIDSIEAVGTCSQRDKFFAYSDGKWKDSVEIDETIILKSAYTNFVVNAITHLLGLRNITWEELGEAGIDTTKIQEIKYKKEERKEKQEERKTSDIEELRKRINIMVQALANEEQDTKKVIKEASLFMVKDRYGNNQEKYVERIEDLTSAGWLSATYGRLKKMYKEKYNTLPWEEAENDY